MKLADLIRGNDRGAISLRLLLSAALVAASAGLGGLGFTSAAAAATPGSLPAPGVPVSKVPMCHDNNGVNDFNEIEPNISAILGRTGHQHDATDVIPPFTYDDNGTNVDYLGLNWPAGATFLFNGCATPGDISVDKTGPGTALQGSTGSYVLTVTNSGPGAVSSPITIVDDVPSGWTVGTVTPGASSGFSCSTAGQQISCTTNENLAVHSAATSPLKVTIQVGYATAGSRTNQVAVSSDADTNLANNQDSVTTVVQAPDLTLAKSGPASVTVGDAGSYVLTATNAGNAATLGTITVSDTLPAGVTPGVLPAGCGLAGGVITCTTAGPLAPAGAVAFTIPVTFSTVGSKVNNATVSGGGEINTGNNAAQATTAVAGIPDLILAKSAPASRVVGQSGTYVLTVTNSGNGPTAGTITVSDAMPAGVTAGVLPAGCVLAAGVITCTAPGPLAPAATLSFTIPVTFGTVGTQVNNATVSGGGQTNTNNDGATASTDVTLLPVPDLTLVKTAPVNVVVGDAGSYVLTVANGGTAGTTAPIVVSDTLPAGVTPGVLPAGCGLAAGVITCTTAGPLAPAGTLSFTIPVTFSTVGSTVNNATVSGGGENNTGNNAAQATTAVAGIPDLVLAKSAPTNALAGATGSYVLTVTNSGNGPTAGTITVSDAMPAGVTAGVLPAGCVLAAGVITCTAPGPLAPAATLSFTIPVTFGTVGTQVNNATVSGGGERNVGNNTAQAATAVAAVPVPDLKLTKAGPATRTTGDTGSYTLVVENVGTGPATDVITVTDTLPAGVTATGTSSGGFTCSVVGSVVTCTTGDDIAVGAGNAKTITLPVTFTTAGNKANTATVTVNGDGNAANDTSAATTSVTDPQGPPPPPPPALPADLAVKKTGPASVTPGGSASWVLTVTNKGPGNAAGFSVTDTLPAGVSLTSISGTSFTCTAATAVCTYNGVLLPGQTAVVDVVAAVASTVAGNSIANVVVVGPTDATPADNTDTLVSVIQRPASPGQADLVLEKTSPTAAVAPGDPITWTLKVTNAGTANASGFVVSDPLALGLALVSAAGDGFSCSGATVSCTYAGPLGPNQVATLLVTAALAEDYTSSSVVNTATVVLDGDPTPANNTDSATTGVNVPISGGAVDPATGEEPAVEPTTPPADGEDEEPATAPDRPRALPFTGGSADTLLALGAGLSLAGLALALTGRRRRSA